MGNIDSKMKTKKPVSKTKSPNTTQNSHAHISKTDEKHASHKESTEHKSQKVIKTKSESRPEHPTTDNKTVEDADADESHHNAAEHEAHENSDHHSEEDEDGNKSRHKEDKHEHDENKNDSPKKHGKKSDHKTGKHPHESLKTTPTTSENEQDSDEEFSPDIMKKIHKATVLAEDKKIMYEKKIQEISRIIHSLKRVEESHDHR